MKKTTLIAVVAPGIAASPMAVAHADPGGYKIIVNGQDISPLSSVSTLECENDGGDITISFTNSSNIVWIDKSGQVTKVDLSNGRKNYLLDPGQRMHERAPLGGDAQATRSGNTFTITGQIAP